MTCTGGRQVSRQLPASHGDTALGRRSRRFLGTDGRIGRRHVVRKYTKRRIQFSELDLPAECVLTAILRDRLLIISKGNTQLLPGDVVLAVAHASTLAELSSLIGQRKGVP